MQCYFFDGGDFAFFLEDEAPRSGLIFLKGQQPGIMAVLGKGRQERPKAWEMELKLQVAVFSAGH
jgi:hypothetical protein